MAEEIHINKEISKEEKYKALIPQLEALIGSENNLIANLANITAALKEVFNFWWVGFYLVDKDDLVLGPFQGPIACTRIALGKGVCGTSWKEQQTIIVDNVELFEGHIACSSLSKSEIVIPVFHSNKIIGVLDVDSEHLAHFDNIDKKYLEEIVSIIKL